MLYQLSYSRVPRRVALVAKTCNEVGPGHALARAAPGYRLILHQIREQVVDLGAAVFAVPQVD